jgi:phosphoglycerate dehydrogenase-like enzyme
VAQRCLSFGMTVLAADPYLSADQVGDERITLVSLRELLRRSVNLHVPATRDERLFDGSVIRR